MCSLLRRRPRFTTSHHLRRALGDVDFPAGKDQLVDRALANGADEQTLRRTHTKPGLAESAKGVAPSPIVEELGTNRGS